MNKYVDKGDSVREKIFFNYWALYERLEQNFLKDLALFNHSLLILKPHILFFPYKKLSVS